MELSWSTFVLEIINFLILVWILKRFLYKPVLAVITQRQQAIKKSMTDAETLQQDATKMRQQYESRLADWDKEKQKARESLNRELDAERNRQLQALDTVLQQEREKTVAAQARRRDDERHKEQQTALGLAARFASRLLEQAAGPDVEKRLVDLLITELSAIPDKRLTALQTSYGNTADKIVVSSAYPLDHEQCQQLEQSLAKIIRADCSIQYEQNPELIAGVEITIGAWVLAANIRDELRGFMELTHSE